MTPPTEIKMITYKRKPEVLNGEDLETQHNIDKHKKAALHHQLAAKYHLEAVQHIEAGNFYLAEESAFIAQGHFALAGQYHTKTSLLYSW